MLYKLAEVWRCASRCGECVGLRDVVRTLGSGLGARLPRDRCVSLREAVASALSVGLGARLPRDRCVSLREAVASALSVGRVARLPRHRSALSLLTRRLTGALRESSARVAQSCVSQLEFVAAQRVRRAQQAVSLYRRLWDDTALRELVGRLRRTLLQRGGLVLGLCAAPVVNWHDEMIADHDILRHTHEIEMCHRLKQQLPTKKGDKEPSQPSQQCLSCESDTEDTCWEPFVATGDLTCWKREAPSRKGSGLYCYKMYGAYNDVSADDFLEAFLDVKERKAWDSHVVDLHVIASDPQSNSDLIYWETKWPTLFSNRDYVFKRRFKILDKEKLIVVCNKSSSHPQYPVNSSKTRVTEYWSYMVIKPFTSFSKPGIEFSLTYFDDPGTSLPSAISSWASTTGMPEFMKKLRLAAKKVADTRASSGLDERLQDDLKSSEDYQEDEDDEEECEPSNR